MTAYPPPNDVHPPAPQTAGFWDHVQTWLADNSTVLIWIGAVLNLALVGVTAWLAFKTVRGTVRLTRRLLAGRSAEDVMTVVAASIATGVSAEGMWRFAGEVLGLSGPLRLLLFSFIEAAVITSAVRARRNMRENYSAGVDGLAVWALTSLSAVLSALHAGSVPEFLFRLAAPLVAAWLWERGMAIERVKLKGRSRIHWTITTERVMVRLGLAEASDRSASEVDAHRRLAQVALAADRVRDTDPGTWRYRSAVKVLKRRGRKAIEHTALASNPVQRLELLDHIGMLRGIEQLPDVEPPSVWGEHLRPSWREPDPAAAAAVAELELFANRAEQRGPSRTSSAPGADLDVSDVNLLCTAAARKYARLLRRKRVPALRDLKRDYGIGQDKATEVQKQLKALAGVGG